MPLEDKKYDVEANNDWAKNVKGEHLFIDNAQSGRKGYFCIGCGKQMEAVIRKKNPKHRSYFRHIPVDIEKDDTPCTFSNRKYREILATDILQRLKRIKVPNLYKYPPNRQEGPPMLLEKAKFIEAAKVKSQLTFYEDNEGAIKHGKNPEVEDRYLLIRPDVTFFDANNKPILLIELVITHKVSDEKKIKLRRLGIDTVSIIIPKSSEQEIEDNFKTTKRVKWEYNGIEANTKYIRVSPGTTEGVLEFDEQQRRIFEEFISCRKARLNNTLRTIKKCLRSESYNRVEQLFEQELSRVEKATKLEQTRLDEQEARTIKEVAREHRKKNLELAERGRKLEERRKKFRDHKTDVEERFLRATRDQEQELEEIRRNTATELEDGGTEGEIREKFRKGEVELRREFKEIEEELRQSIKETGQSIIELSEKERELSGSLDNLRDEKRISADERRERIRENNRTKFEHKESALSAEIRREEKAIRKLQNRKTSLPESFEQLEEQEQQEFREAKIRLREQEENIEKTIREELAKDLREASSRLPREVSFILEAERVGRDYAILQRQEEYYNAARKFLKKGTWKK